MRLLILLWTIRSTNYKTELTSWRIKWRQDYYSIHTRLVVPSGVSLCLSALCVQFDRIKRWSICTCEICSFDSSNLHYAKSLGIWWLWHSKSLCIFMQNLHTSDAYNLVDVLQSLMKVSVIYLFICWPRVQIILWIWNPCTVGIWHQFTYYHTYSSI